MVHLKSCHVDGSDIFPVKSLAQHENAQQRVQRIGRAIWNEDKMKKILVFLCFSLMMAACGSVSPASPTAIPTRPIAITPIVTSFQPQVTATSIIPYTSTPAGRCPTENINGP